jgi:Protein of unknown function (DUF4019)
MKRALAVFSLIVMVSSGLHAAAATREQAAQEAAQQWLSLVDAGDYAESWQTASGGFKHAVSQQQWQDALTAVRRPLGDLEKREFKSAEYKTSLPGVPDGEYVVLIFNTVFENKKAAVETLTMQLEKDGTWRSSGYFIR